MANNKIGKDLSSYQKWLISLIIGLLFIIIASPVLFKGVDYIISKIGLGHIANRDGLPNSMGLIVHGLVFFLIIRAFMEIKF